MRAARQCVVLVLCLAAVVHIAWARPFLRPKDPQACAHLDRGNKLYNVGRFQDAIAEYEAGALIEPAAVFDYNLGQANRHLENYRAALWHYERFLHKASPTGEVRDAVIAFIAEMKAHLENKAQRMPSADPEPPTPTVTGARPAAAQRAPVGAVDASRSQDRSRSEPRHRDWIGWSVTAMGVAGLGVGAYLVYDASQLDDRSVSPTQSQGQREQLGRDAHAGRVAGAITTSGGAALVIAGIVKLALHDDNPASMPTWNITAMHHGVMVLGRF